MVGPARRFHRFAGPLRLIVPSSCTRCRPHFKKKTMISFLPSSTRRRVYRFTSQPFTPICPPYAAPESALRHPARHFFSPESTIMLPAILWYAFSILIRFAPLWSAAGTLKPPFQGAGRPGRRPAGVRIGKGNDSDAKITRGVSRPPGDYAPCRAKSPPGASASGIAAHLTGSRNKPGGMSPGETFPRATKS